MSQERSHYGQTQSAIAQLPEDKTGDIKQKQQRYRDTRKETPDNPWWRDTSACNLWTAAFFTPLTEQKLQLLPTSSALFQLLRESGKNLEINFQANNPNLLKQTDDQIDITSVRVKTIGASIQRKNKTFSQRENKGFSLSRTQVE